jgi:hypothetical protein
MLLINESSVGAYLLIALCLTYFVVTFTYHLFTTLVEYQPYYFPLLLKLATKKDKMDWNYSMRRSRLRVASVAIPVVLWSLPLFHFADSRHSL